MHLLLPLLPQLQVSDLASAIRDSCDFCHSGGFGPFSPQSPSVLRLPVLPRGMGLQHPSVTMEKADPAKGHAPHPG